MKRYLCTVAAGFALALVSTATASADIGLPLPGQSGEQETNLGDQIGGEAENDADVTQEQGNDNMNIAPAIAVFGDAETTNEQGNGNTASPRSTRRTSRSVADVGAGAVARRSELERRLLRRPEPGRRADGRTAATSRWRSRRTTPTSRRSRATATSRSSPRSRSSAMPRPRTRRGTATLRSPTSIRRTTSTSRSPRPRSRTRQAAEPSKGYDKKDEKGKELLQAVKSQTGEQKTSFGDQTVGKQENDADVTQKQGNDNVDVSPAIAIFGDAETTNAQGNGNDPESDVDQGNEVEQAQESYQRQSLGQGGSSNGHCCGGSSQTGEQKRLRSVTSRSTSRGTRPT